MITGLKVLFLALLALTVLGVRTQRKSLTKAKQTAPGEAEATLTVKLKSEELTNLDNSVNELKNADAQFSQEVTDLKNDDITQLTKLDEMQNQVEQLKGIVEQLQNDFLMTKQTLQDVKVQSDFEINTLKESLQKSENELSEFKTKTTEDISGLTSDLSTTSNDLANFKQETSDNNNNVQQSLHDTREDLENTKQNLDFNVNKLTQSIQETDYQVNDLKTSTNQQISDLNSQMVNVQTDLSNYKTSNDNEISALKSDIENLKSKTALRILGTGSSRNWQVYGDQGIYTYVDFTNLHLTSVPQVFTSIRGLTSHWTVMGTTSIYDLSSHGFSVYIFNKDAVPDLVKFANDNDWVLEYILVGN